MKGFSIESLDSTLVSWATNCLMIVCTISATDSKAKYAI